MLKEFKKFIARGNVLDMAVGIIVGSAFTAIVNSLVNDIFSLVCLLKLEKQPLHMVLLFRRSLTFYSLHFQYLC